MIYKMILFLGYSPKDAERHTGVRPIRPKGAMMTQFCKHCGHLLPDGAKFCDACGASTEEAKTPFAAGPQYEPWHDAALQDKFLGFRGRLNRKRYFQRTLILAGLQVLWPFSLGYSSQTIQAVKSCFTWPSWMQVFPLPWANLQPGSSTPFCQSFSWALPCGASMTLTGRGGAFSCS